MTTNVIFDADDTLWYTEVLYDNARTMFVELLVQNGLGESSEIADLSRTIDHKNSKTMQLSRARFPKSLLDTYKRLHSKRHLAFDEGLSAEIKRIGESVFENRAQNVDHVESTLSSLKGKGVNLILWTQGDIDVQKKRIEESGLNQYFDDDKIHITNTKSAEKLKGLLEKLSLKSEDTWVVGNSIKSDINTALDAGLKCIWIPSNVWNREKDEIHFPPSGELVYQIDSIEEIPQIIFKSENIENIEAQSKLTDGVVYLFVSAYQDLYRQYIMDILAYPRGYIFKFPYDARRWLPPPFRNDKAGFNKFAGLLKSRKAMVVFVDERVEREPRRIQRFLPLRESKIRDNIKIEEGVLLIEFELGRYVVFDDENQSINEYDEFIKTIAARPRPNKDDCSYISIGPNYEHIIKTEKTEDKDASQTETDRGDAWQTVTDKLGRLNTIPRKVKANRYTPVPIDPFEKAMFFRVTSLEEFRSKKSIFFRLTSRGKDPSKKRLEIKTFFENESGYELSASKNYRLNLLFYFPNRPHSLVRRSKIITNLTSEFVNPVGRNDIPLNFRYDRRHIDFITDKVFTDIWTSLSIYAQAPQDSANPILNQVVTPEPTFLLKIKTDSWVNVGAPLIFALATIVSSLNALFASLLVTWFPTLVEKQISAALAITGSTIATLLLFNLYRKLK